MRQAIPNEEEGLLPKNEDDSPTCCVCYDNMTAWQRLTLRLTTLPCKHAYHTKCIEPWVKQRGECPLCRRPVCTFDLSFPLASNNLSPVTGYTTLRFAPRHVESHTDSGTRRGIGSEDGWQIGNQSLLLHREIFLLLCASHCIRFNTRDGWDCPYGGCACGKSTGWCNYSTWLRIFRRSLHYNLLFAGHVGRGSAEVGRECALSFVTTMYFLPTRLCLSIKTSEVRGCCEVMNRHEDRLATADMLDQIPNRDRTSNWRPNCSELVSLTNFRRI